MKNKLLCFAIIFVILISNIVGCGNNTASSSSDKKIFLTINEMDTFRQTLVDATVEKASESGIQIEVGDAQNSIEAQVQMIKNAAEQNYDVILCGAVSTDTAVELKASAGDIPIIFLNSCPKESVLSEGQYVYVGSDEQVAGQLQAEYILQKFENKDEINVVILKGPKGHSATKGRTSGAKKTLNESGKKINYVFEEYANWDSEQAKELFKLFLKTGSEVDCVICNNDSMALGVVEACKEAGIDLNSVPVVGVDATADGCQSIQNGDMAFTVYQSGSGQGSKAVEMAMELMNGQDGQNLEGITEDGLYVWVPFEGVDSNNVANYIK